MLYLLSLKEFAILANTSCKRVMKVDKMLKWSDKCLKYRNLI